MAGLLALSGGFRVLAEASEPPASTLALSGGFRIRAAAPPATVHLHGTFALRDPEPTVFVWVGDEWQPSAQRVWDGTDWFPPVLA